MKFLMFVTKMKTFGETSNSSHHATIWK